MPTFKIDVAMDIRAYGYVEIEADDIDAAVKIATPAFISENFELQGGGADDFDYTTPRDIWLGEYENRDTDEEGYIERDLPNSHYPGGLVQDAAQDMLAALKQAESDQMAYVDRLYRDGPRMAGSLSEARKRLDITRAAIAKAEAA